MLEDLSFRPERDSFIVPRSGETRSSERPILSALSEHPTPPTASTAAPGASSARRLLVTNITRGTVVAESVEIADTGRTRNKGLLGRSGLPSGGGLWIVPCESVHTFWMKFPLDLVYIDRRHRVKKVRYSVPAWRVSACLSAHSVLELPAGAIERSQTEPGDELSLAER